VGVPARLSIGDSTTEQGGWWNEAAELGERAIRSANVPERMSFRFGDAVLEVDSTYRPLLDDLLSAYADCALADGGSSAPHRVRCSARAIEGRSLVALRFDTPSNLPNLCEVALSLTRPRLELQHFAVRELDRPGWRLLANALDERAPLLAGDTGAAIIDVRVEPPELLVNFVVGVVQLAQQSVLFIHAGGVSIDGRGTLVVGRSGKGKSTTTVALASRGHALLGDETIGLREDSREIVAFRRTLKLRPGPGAHVVLERLKAMPHATRMDGQGLVCAWVGGDALFPGTTPALCAPLRDVFFLRSFREHAAVEAFVPTLEHVEELRALPMSLSAIVSWPKSAAHRLMRFARVIELLAQCRCYFLDLGTPDETAELIERTVRNHA
jgi:hypothetical protein